VRNVQACHPDPAREFRDIENRIAQQRAQPLLIRSLSLELSQFHRLEIREDNCR
jgi:hypothetical protein